MLYPLSYEGGRSKDIGERRTHRPEWSPAWLIP